MSCTYIPRTRYIRTNTCKYGNMNTSYQLVVVLGSRPRPRRPDVGSRNTAPVRISAPSPRARHLSRPLHGHHARWVGHKVGAISRPRSEPAARGRAAVAGQASAEEGGGGEEGIPKPGGAGRRFPPPSLSRFPFARVRSEAGSHGARPRAPRGLRWPPAPPPGASGPGASDGQRAGGGPRRGRRTTYTNSPVPASPPPMHASTRPAPSICLFFLAWPPPSSFPRPSQLSDATVPYSARASCPSGRAVNPPPRPSSCCSPHPGPRICDPLRPRVIGDPDEERASQMCHGVHGGALRTCSPGLSATYICVYVGTSYRQVKGQVRSMCIPGYTYIHVCT